MDRSPISSNKHTYQAKSHTKCENLHTMHRDSIESLNSEYIEQNDIESRINEFLDDLGVEISSPWVKVSDYWDQRNKKILQNENENNETNPSCFMAKKQNFKLSCPLYLKRMQGKVASKFSQ